MKKQKLKSSDSEKMTQMLAAQAELEKDGRFDEDVDTTPPWNGRPRKTDLVNKKITSKIKTGLGNFIAVRYYNHLFRTKQVVFAGAKGYENLAGFTGGAIVTCNHCHSFDHYGAYLGLKKHFGRRFRLWKIVKEGNFHSGGISGFLTRNCNTLPISDSPKTAAKCMRATETLLKQNKKIAVFPEQALWWYYRKPRPLKNGAFLLAAKFNAPIIPCFLTFSDASGKDGKPRLGKDGQPVQEFTLNVLPLLRPDPNLSVKENTESLKNENARLWQQCFAAAYL